MSSVPSRDPRERLCLSLDDVDMDRILRSVDELSEYFGYVKINFAFTLHGPELIARLHERGVKVFLDLKLHDIPNTLAGYAEAVTRLGVELVTLHTTGGLEMMSTAVAAADRTAREISRPRPLLVGVTVLTSIDEEQLARELGVGQPISEVIRARGALAAEAGLDGMVCGPGELGSVRDVVPDDFFFVTPGLRGTAGQDHDHKRTGSYRNALEGGASLMVVGRDVMHSDNRVDAAKRIFQEIAEFER
ncbi:orotidine-5'-phosphate decarboxylase [Nocardia sp. NPDC088792]|uniref:orotidine-5'-phosphate decarboxylase n=1 Tax=Nocardia sp. NPDC088792 TaxID=3364332 RepID=UPI0037F58A5D